MNATANLAKVGECLYRKGHGTYFALFKVRGTLLKRSLKTDDAALAKRRLADLRTKVHGLADDNRSVSFDALAQRWLAVMKPDLRPNSWRRLDGIVRTVMPFFKGLPVRSIGMTHIERWKVKRGTAVSPRSFNYEREVLRRLFEYARTSARVILENPMAEIKKRKVGKSALIIPTKEQFRQLIAAMRAHPLSQDSADFIEFLGYSGLRLGEATQVLWRDIDFDAETMLVTGGNQGTKNHEVRTVPLFPPLKKHLERLAASRNEPASARIFPIQSAKKALATACRKASLPNFGHHAMRHFFCSNAIEAGCDFKVIAGWLGHKDGGVLVAMTYGHLRNEHSTAMAKRMTFGLETQEHE